MTDQGPEIRLGGEREGSRCSYLLLLLGIKNGRNWGKKTLQKAFRVKGTECANGALHGKT